jgi:hypothetical protein
MRYFLWFNIALIFGSCDTDLYGKGIPDDLVERDTFILILQELTVIETYVQNTYTHVSVYKELMEKSGEAIFRKHKVTPAQFERTMNYYGTHQSELQSIYAQVLDSLNKEASRLPELSLSSSDTLSVSMFKRLTRGSTE